MMVSGETLPFVEAIEFTEKKQLMERLKEIKKSAAGLPEPDKTIVEQMVTAGIQEIADCPERDLLDFKRYLQRHGSKRPA